MRHLGHPQRGMTMIEAIIVIVITGIIGSVVAMFIRLPVRGYTDAVARAAATDLADSAMRRLARDLRLALPNSIRAPAGAGSKYIEFIETTAGLRYLAEDDMDAALLPGNYLNWNDQSKLRFTVVGGVPTDRHRPVPGHSVVVYNLGPTQEPANAYDCTTRCNLARIASVDATSITLATNPFARQAASGVALTSPGRRFHVVTTPVTYFCDTAKRRLIRYWDYGFKPSQPNPPIIGGKSAILAENVNNCSFRYDNLANQRNGLVGISLELRVRGERDSLLALEHQVHVDNTP